MWTLSDAKEFKDSLLRSHQTVLEGTEKMEQTVMEALVVGGLSLLEGLLLLVLISKSRRGSKCIGGFIAEQEHVSFLLDGRMSS